MSDNRKQGVESKSHNEAPKKRSFFGGEINEKTKDLLDFRYNTQEEIDKLNDQMTTATDLDEMIRQTSNPETNEDNGNIDNENEEYLKEKDEKEAESNLEEDLQPFAPSPTNNGENDNYDEIYEKENDPIEGEIVDNPDKDNDTTNEEKVEDRDTENTEPQEEKIDDINKIPEEPNEENPENKIEETEPKGDEIANILDGEDQEDTPKENSMNEEVEESTSAKFFDPFEINIDEEEQEIPESNNENFDPFTQDEEGTEQSTEEEQEIDKETEEESIGIKDTEAKEEVEEPTEQESEEAPEENEEENEEEIEEISEEETEEETEDKTEEQTEEQIEQTEEKVEEVNEKIEESDEQQSEEIQEGVNEENNGEIEEQKEEVVNTTDQEDDEENEEENNKDSIIINAPISSDPNKKTEKEETIKNKKIKKNSATGEIVTQEEIQLEQGQDTPNSEDDEDYQPSAEEIFEQEPEFFADDELSQQFMRLVQNVRGIFKLERKDGEQNPYFKILGGKTADSTLEYLFYLIEEENEPIDLYIKKVERNENTEEENEHLVQFSYNKDQELNIFVDEVILYEKINKSDSDTPEYNDTKAILEKFIFLTENYYDELKDEIDKQREEKQKKRQLQQIFKGF